MVTQETKIKALAKALDVDVSEIKEGYDDYVFEVDDGTEYIVADYEEAYDLACRDIKSIMDDLGLDAFTESFQERIMEEFLDNDRIAEVLWDDLYYGYLDDLPDEDLEDLCNTLDVDFEEAKDDRSVLVDAYMDYYDYTNNPIEYYQDLMTDREFYKWISDNGFLDEDAICDECIAVDGIAHTLASYDGEELELDNRLYAYRIN